MRPRSADRRSQRSALVRLGLAALGIAAITAACGDGDSTRDNPAEDRAGGTAGSAERAHGGEAGSTADSDAGAATSGHSGDGGGESGSGAECDEDSDCTALGECYSTVCEGGACVGGVRQRGSACDGGFCNGFARCLRCLDEADGTERDPGCTTAAPKCLEAASPAICVACESDADCDDGIACSADRCRDSECEHDAIPLGGSCSGGVCDGRAEADSCVPCIDDASAGPDRGCTKERPRCDTSRQPVACTGCELLADCDDGNECTADACSAGACEHVTLPSGSPCVGGYCNGVAGAEICIPKPCEDDPSCDDGVACSAQRCDDTYRCTYTLAHEQCPNSGDVCRPNRCGVGVGCRPVDVSRSLELLRNGHFEDGNTVWTEVSSNYPQVIFLFDYVPTLRAHTESFIAWLGGGEGPVDEHNSLSQVVTVPAASVALELSFFYQVWSDDLPDDQNHLTVRLRASDASQPDEELVTFHNQDEIRVWTLFTTSIDASRWAGTDAVLEFRGASVDGYTAFFVDTASLRATVCEP